MKIREMPLSAYYHRYLVVEADALTEICRRKIEVDEEDCYALCSAFCNPYGLLMLAVLAIGPSVNDCRKGLYRDDMIGVLTMDKAAECNAVMIDGNAEMERKARWFIGLTEKDADEDIIAARMDWRLDDVRDLWYPDDVLVGIIRNGNMTEYAARVEGICGPFLKCSLLENVPGYLYRGDILYVFPYKNEEEDGCRLYAMFNSRSMNAEEKKAFHKIMNVSDRYGISFSGTHIRS